jgi:hypothetical protein
MWICVDNITKHHETKQGNYNTITFSVDSRWIEYYQNLQRTKPRIVKNTSPNTVHRPWPIYSIGGSFIKDSTEEGVMGVNHMQKRRGSLAQCLCLTLVSIVHVKYSYFSTSCSLSSNFSHITEIFYIGSNEKHCWKQHVPYNIYESTPPDSTFSPENQQGNHVP